MIRIFTAILFLSSLSSFSTISNDIDFDEAYDSARNTINEEIDRSLLIMELVEDIATDNKDELQLAKCYWMYGYIYQCKSDTRNAKRYYNGAYKIYEKEGEYLNMARMLENLGTLSYSNGLYKSALRLFEKRLVLVEEKLDKYEELVDAYFDLGLVLREMHEYELSAKSFMSSLKILTIKGGSRDFDWLSRVNNELGLTIKKYAMFAGKPDILDSAKNCFSMAIEWAELSVNKFHPTNNIGNVYYVTNDLLLSEEWMNKAYKIGVELNSDRLLIPLLNNLGKVHFEKGNYVLADSLFKKSLAFNLMDYSVDDIMHDEKLDLNFNMLNEVVVSMYYLDSLSEKIGVRTIDNSIIARIKREDIDRRMLEQQNLRETNAEELRIMEAEQEAFEKQQILIRYLFVGGLFMSLVIVAFLVYRVSKLEVFRSRALATKGTIEGRVKKLQERFPHL
jgi:tetratricopeptide (TPR) repeat protein